MRDGSEIVKTYPKKCPICGAFTEFDGENLFCTGINCTPQLEGKIKHFASKNAMDIDGLGEKTVREFFKRGIVKTISDIYKLEEKEEEICSLEGFGKKKFQRIMEGVKKSKKRNLANLIYGLSIRLIGESASKDLANEFKSMEEILKISKNKEQFKERLLAIDDFGEAMSMSIIDFFSNKDNLQTIEELLSFGVNSTIAENATVQNQMLEGETFVVTGKVNHFKNRKELQLKIEELGGKVTGSVSKNTDYLINNDIKNNSSKNRKAKELNIPIISEEEFLKLIK